MNEKDIIAAMQASINNHEKCCSFDKNKRGFIYKVKYLVWYVLLILFSPRYVENGKIFAACMTSVNEKRISEFVPEVSLYRFARLNASLSKIKSNISVVSDLNKKQRIRLLLKSIRFYKKNRSFLKGYFHFVIEYYAIASFLYRNRFEEYITPGMYERYCTLFSYLGKMNGVKLVGIQDGAAININVPALIYCNEMYAFDKYEVDILKRFIKNGDCKFIYVGFRSVLQWSHYNKSNKKVMAIASQDWFTNTTIQMTGEIMKSSLTNSWDIILLPHYRESMKSYELLERNYPTLIIESQKRYDNVDLLITFYSTIVYDFWSVNPGLQVYCLQIPGYVPGYYERDNVKVFHKVDEMVSDLLASDF